MTAARRGIACSLADVREPWLAQVRAVLDEATLDVPDAGTAPGTPRIAAAGRAGIPKRWDRLLAEMQFLQRAYPGAAW